MTDPSIPGNAYTWNERNQLSSATAGGVASSYAYDALGRRVGQTRAGLTAQYVYDMLNIAQEQFSSGGVADMLAGLYLDENFARTDASGSSAMLPDLLGSTLGLVNSAGAISTGYQYGPFGQTTTSGASSTNPLQYTGRELDSTGLDFMRARYYNPIAQRFISPDPIGLAGGQANFYAYVFNDPMDWTDPLGLWGGSVGGGPAPGSSAAGCGDEGSVCVGGRNVGQTPTSGYMQLAVVVKKFIFTPTPVPPTNTPTNTPSPSPSPTPFVPRNSKEMDQFILDQIFGSPGATPTPSATPTPGIGVPPPPMPGPNEPSGDLLGG